MNIYQIKFIPYLFLLIPLIINYYKKDKIAFNILSSLFAISQIFIYVIVLCFYSIFDTISIYSVILVSLIISNCIGIFLLFDNNLQYNEKNSFRNEKFRFIFGLFIFILNVIFLILGLLTYEKLQKIVFVVEVSLIIILFIEYGCYGSMQSIIIIIGYTIIGLLFGIFSFFIYSLFAYHFSNLNIRYALTIGLFVLIIPFLIVFLLRNSYFLFKKEKKKYSPFINKLMFILQIISIISIIVVSCLSFIYYEIKPMFLYYIIIIIMFINYFYLLHINKIKTLKIFFVSSIKTIFVGLLILLPILIITNLIFYHFFIFLFALDINIIIIANLIKHYNIIQYKNIYTNEELNLMLKNEDFDISLFLNNEKEREN